eukprot:15032524-Ditylum_brightwellii.AAC.1
MDLKWEAQLNIIADKLGHIAKHQITPNEKHQFSLLPAGKAYLFIKNPPITRNLKQSLHNAEHHPKLTEFIRKKFNMTQDALPQAERTHFGQVITSLDYYTHWFVI